MRRTLTVSCTSPQKSLTIFGSALYGGATVATCLDYFLEGSVMLLWVWDKVRVKKSPQPCWFSWVVLGVWPTCLALGNKSVSFIPYLCKGVRCGPRPGLG